MDVAKLQRTLDDLPQARRQFTSLVRMSRDLLNQPHDAPVTQADVVALARGDLMGDAKNKAGVMLIDHDMQDRFGGYRQAVEELVGIARRHEQLAFALRSPLWQINNLLANISGFMFAAGTQSPPTISHDANAIQARAQEHLSKINEINRFGTETVAFKRGGRGDEWADKGLGSPGPSIEGDENKASWYRTRKITIRSVVELLKDAAESNRPLERGQAKIMLFILAMSDYWLLTAPVHPSGSDSRPHITLLVQPGGTGDQFHLYVYETHNRGFCLSGQITHGRNGTPL